MGSLWQLRPPCKSSQGLALAWKPSSENVNLLTLRSPLLHPCSWLQETPSPPGPIPLVSSANTCPPWQNRHLQPWASWAPGQRWRCGVRTQSSPGASGGELACVRPARQKEPWWAHGDSRGSPRGPGERGSRCRERRFRQMEQHMGRTQAQGGLFRDGVPLCVGSDQCPDGRGGVTRQRQAPLDLEDLTTQQFSELYCITKAPGGLSLLLFSKSVVAKHDFHMIHCSYLWVKFSGL